MVKLTMANPTIKDTEFFELTEKHIRLEGKKGYFNQEWNIFKEVHEDENSILLYQSKNKFFLFFPNVVLQVMK